MIKTKTLAIAFGVCAGFAADSIPAATLNIGQTSVVIAAGQTIEILVSSDQPIASDFVARGAFESGDVRFTDGPGCQLSAHGCTLIITAALTSKSYSSVPVRVSTSSAKNVSTFLLSVIGREETVPAKTDGLKTNSPPRIFSSHASKTRTVTVKNDTSHDQRSKGLSNLSATIVPHTVGSSFYTASSNGPVYQMITITNNGGGAVTLDAPIIAGGDAGRFSIDTTGADYAGSPTFCNNAPTLANGDSCEIIIRSTLGDPASAAATSTLTISDGVADDTLTFTLTDTTYVYAAGGFDNLGNASVSGGDLLVECTAGTCSNALQGTTGNNYSETNFSVGQWINALAITPTGNLVVGGVFGAIGGATSGASSGTAALLAQCTPGPVTGNACINQVNTGATSNAYAFNNAYIDGIAAPFLISGVNYLAVVGDFGQFRASSVTSGRMLAKCQYVGAAASATCNNFIGNAASSNKFGNSAIVAVDTLGSTSGSPLVNVGGLFTQIAGYPGSVPSSGTTFAVCTNGVAGSCSKGMSSNNPNGSILGMSNDGTNLYIGGKFTEIGGYVDGNGGYPLVSCTPGNTTTCSNALSGTNDANGRIQGLAYSGGSLYVGGRFTTIGGATPVGSGNMLAVCTPGGACDNFVTDVHPYASGSDWGGGITSVAIGNQTSITAN